MSVGLVLEGGGMRGAYTSGVLDVLLQYDLEFPSVYGISAGACNGVSYVSRQPGRNLEIFYNYIADDRYLSVSNLRKTGSLFGFDFIFGELFHELVPLDYKTFFDSPVRFYAGATDLETGRAVYFEKAEMDELLTPVRASSSIPMVSRAVEYRDHFLLDGGVADPIPIARSIADGNNYNVIVLTRDISYRKRPRPEFPRAVLRAVFGDYPNFIETMMIRPSIYNGQIDECRRLEKCGRAVVIRPSSPIVTGRYEKDPDRLKGIYDMGVADAEKKVAEIKALLRAQG